MTNKTVGLRIIAISVSILIVMAVAAHAQKSTIIIAAMDWPPYSAPYLPEKGFLSDLAVTILKRAGYNAEVTFYPWARAVRNARYGECQALLGAGVTDERKEWGIFPAPLFDDKMVFITNKKKGVSVSEIHTIRELAPATITVINGSMWIDEWGNIPGIMIETANSIEQNIKKVIYGRTDYTFESQAALDFYLNHSLSVTKDQISCIVYLTDKTDTYLLFTKKMTDYEKVSDDYNSALKSMKADGTYEKILHRHGITYSGKK